MQLGFFTMPVHPLGKDWRQCLREDEEAFILADELGYTEAYCGEHVTDLAENITSCMLFLAGLASRTKRIKLGTGTVNLPNTHPAAVAAHAAMLDHMLDGRLILGVSPGGLLSDAEAFGNLDSDRNAMFVEAMDMLLALWTREAPYQLNGRFWRITTDRTFFPEIGQGILPQPLQRPHPPIVVTAVAPFSKGVTEAAARGWDPISANFLMPTWVKSHWPKYAEGCVRVGRPADLRNWRVAKSVCVAADDATARDYALGPQSPYRAYYHSLLTKLARSGRIELFKESRDMADSEVTLDYVLDRLVIWGSPDRVADRILEFRDQVGDFGTMLYAGKDWVDRDIGRRSMILLAEKVMPKLEQAAAAPPAKPEVQGLSPIAAGQ